MNHPGLCVTVTGSTMAELRRERDRASEADLVELRLDGVDHPDAAGCLEGRTRPVIVTCRPAWEGGRFTGSEEERRRLLETAVTLGADFVDVEARAEFAEDLLRRHDGGGIVLSEHWFDGIPADLEGRYSALRARGAEVVKLAVSTERLSDVLRLFDLAARVGGEDGRHVLVGMGPSGIPSRVLAARLRNRWTYAGNGIAPGQLSASHMLNAFRYRDIRPGAALYGVVGNPVSHSLSPPMHNAGFAARGINAVYVPLQAADADDFVRFARAMGLRGASITAPFKVALLGCMDEVDSTARRVGAVNTLVVRDGRWIGANTDVDGFLAPLAGRIRLKGIRATVLGAGGAARAVAIGLADQGAVVTVCARQSDAARRIAERVGGRAGEFPPRPGSWDVLVNATSAGSPAHPESPIEGVELDGEIVFDLVYAPAMTRLLADARAAGCLAIGGIEMLVAQAERQFELWTGERPPDGLFRSAATSLAIEQP